MLPTPRSRRNRTPQERNWAIQRGRRSLFRGGTLLALALLAGCRSERVAFQFRPAAAYASAPEKGKPTSIPALTYAAATSRPAASQSSESRSKLMPKRQTSPPQARRHLRASLLRKSRVLTAGPLSSSLNDTTKTKRRAAGLFPSGPIDYQKNGFGLMGFGALISAGSLLFAATAGSNSLGEAIVTGYIAKLFFIGGLILIGLGVVYLFIHNIKKQKNPRP